MNDLSRIAAVEMTQLNLLLAGRRAGAAGWVLEVLVETGRRLSPRACVDPLPQPGVQETLTRFQNSQVSGK